MFLQQHEITLVGELIVADGSRVLFWPARKMLILADLHLGKAQHFRAAGIAVPPHVTEATLQRLVHVIDRYKPDTILILGDLFHSSKYEDLPLFFDIRETYRNTSWVIIQGNHDKGLGHHAAHLNFTFIPDILIEAPFIFHHGNIERETTPGQYQIFGHIHPGVTIYGKGGLKERIPCFKFSTASAILPAFGGFTGLHSISYDKEDTILGVVSDTICPVYSPPAA